MNVHVCHPLNTSVANPILQKALGMGFVVGVYKTQNTELQNNGIAE